MPVREVVGVLTRRAWITAVVGAAATATVAPWGRSRTAELRVAHPAIPCRVLDGWIDVAIRDAVGLPTTAARREAIPRVVRAAAERMLTRG